MKAPVLQEAAALREFAGVACRFAAKLAFGDLGKAFLPVELGICEYVVYQPRRQATLAQLGTDPDRADATSVAFTRKCLGKARIALQTLAGKLVDDV